MLKHEKEQEKKKFKEMSFKKKIEHIREYYIWHILGSIGLLLVIFSFLNIYIFNPAPKPSVQVVFVGKTVNEEQVSTLQDILTKQFPEMMNETENTEIFLSPIILGGSDPTINMASTQKVMAMIAAKDIDIMIGEKELMMNYASQSTFSNLDEIMTEEQLNRYKDYLTEVSLAPSYYDDEEVQENEVEAHNYLINVSHVPELQSIVLGEDVYMGVVSNSGRMPNVEKIMTFLLDSEQ